MEKKLKQALFYPLLLSIILPLRNLFTNPFGDELTYIGIAESTLENGFYSLNGMPSGITPIIPYLLIIFNKFSLPINHLLFPQLIGYFSGLLGVWYFYKYLMIKNIDHTIAVALVLFVTSNPVFIAWTGALYPESFIFLSFWVFMYYYNKKISLSSWIVLLLSGCLMVLARYVYAVLGVMIMEYLIRLYISLRQKKEYHRFLPFVLAVLIVGTPLLAWFFHVYTLEKATSSGLSYFTRFQEQTLLDRVKAGLGLVIAPNTSRINGIPAFITMFVPITGFRSWLLSLPLLLVVFISFWQKKSLVHKDLFRAMILVLLGYVFSGTGFSRYWLALLPVFILGFYLILPSENSFFRKMFVLASFCMSLVYIVNELRITAMIFLN